MINKNELRLGNYVMDIVSKEWMIVDEIGENVGGVLINRDKYPLQPGWEMGPIPITEEILDKCFVFKSNKVWMTGSMNKIGWRRAWFVGIFDGFVLFLDDREMRVGREFEFMHELQNLYFALNGTEVKIIE